MRTGKLLIAGCFVYALTMPVAARDKGNLPDHTVPGKANQQAIELARRSPLIQSGFQFLVAQATSIHDPELREATLDVISTPDTCVAHRVGVSDKDKDRIVEELLRAGLLDPAEDVKPPGLKAGVFPPLPDDGSACPHLPQTFFSAPGSVFGGHHSYPGGLVVHTANNEVSAVRLAGQYRQVYGHPPDGLPVMNKKPYRNPSTANSAAWIDQDLVVAAPIWHDWAKTIVFQWNEDGTELAELALGDRDCSAAHNSCTGAHHILGLAEAMKRGVKPASVISQASAHAAPRAGAEATVVNWLRAAAIIAQIDPVAKGYLSQDADKSYHLPPLPNSATFKLDDGKTEVTRFRIEYMIINLSDADYVFSEPSLHTVDLVLKMLAPDFGFDPADQARYNNGFRNPVLTMLSGERLFMLYTSEGVSAVRQQVQKLFQCSRSREAARVECRFVGK